MARHGLGTSMSLMRAHSVIYLVAALKRAVSAPDIYLQLVLHTSHIHVHLGEHDEVDFRPLFTFPRGGTGSHTLSPCTDIILRVFNAEDIYSQHSSQLRIEILFHDMRAGASVGWFSSSISIAHFESEMLYW